MDHPKYLGVTAPVRYNNPTIDQLDTFDNPSPDSFYRITLVSEDLTSLDPKTGFPDYCELSIQYVPRKLCLETKSLKLYLCAYRNEAMFMEKLINQIHSDLIKKLSPVMISTRGTFNSRDGISGVVEALYDKQIDAFSELLTKPKEDGIMFTNSKQELQ